MFLVLDNTDIIECVDFRQHVTFNNGTVEERATFSLDNKLYTRENVDMLKKYFKKGDGKIYNLSLKNEKNGEVTRSFDCNGFISIEWVAPENSRFGEPYFMVSAQELIF